jgi:xanthine dehydrogenase small subunit
LPVAHKIQFWLNDRRIETGAVPGTTTLLRYLRDHLHLTGTKEGCAEGDCGACTVTLIEERPGETPTFRAVNSCLLFLPMLQGKRVYTVEGLRDRTASADPAAGYHPAQLAMVETRGSQCGYCTPGIVMSLFEATYREDMGEDWQVDDQLCGNLCRCTGYRPIREAGKKIAGLRPDDRFRAAAAQYQARDAALELRAVDGLAGDQIYVQPTTLDDYFAARQAHPDAVLLAGGTDLGLAVTKHHRHFPAVIGLEGLGALRRLERTEAGWTIGAGVNLTRVMETAGADFPALHRMLRWFGSRQIRSRATLGGNLGTASPIGDMAPTLAGLGATVVLAGSGGERRVPLDAFFTGYRQTALEGDELILAVEIPFTPPDAYCSSFKVSKRREMDISSVAAGMFVQTDADGVVTAIRLAYGGVAGVSAARARNAEAALLGKPWSMASVEAALPSIDEDFTPLSDQRGSADYRTLVARNLLVGFFVESQQPDRGRLEPRPVGTAAVGGVA